MERLKPNGISHTAYPDQPCTDFNEWSAHITAQEVLRETEKFKQDLKEALDVFFKERVEWMFEEFKKEIERS
jgi:hypothetical protein